MKLLYAYRGWILGILAVVMLLLPGSAVDDVWLQEVLPLSVVLLVAFSVLRISARRCIGEHTRGSVHDADRLVTWGIYQRVRHPLYLSNAGVGYSFVVLHFGSNLMALFFVLTLFSFEFLLSRLEDRYLESRFGEEWRSWAAVTPAFIPRLSGGPKCDKVSASDSVGCRSFWAAFKADASTWFWLAVAIAMIMVRKLVG